MPSRLLATALATLGCLAGCQPDGSVLASANAGDNTAIPADAPTGNNVQIEQTGCSHCDDPPPPTRDGSVLPEYKPCGVSERDSKDMGDLGFQANLPAERRAALRIADCLLRTHVPGATGFLSTQALRRRFDDPRGAVLLLIAAIDRGIADAPRSGAKCPLSSSDAVDAIRTLQSLREDGIALLPTERSKLAGAVAQACMEPKS